MRIMFDSVLVLIECEEKWKKKSLFWEFLMTYPPSYGDLKKTKTETENRQKQNIIGSDLNLSLKT